MLQDRSLGQLPRFHLRLLTPFTIGFLSWPNSVNLNQWRSQRLIDAIIYGTSITKAQEKLLQTPLC